MKNKKLLLIIFFFIIVFLSVNYLNKREGVKIDSYQHQEEKVEKEKRDLIILEKPPFLD
jgi:thioredoxin-related protein